MASLNDTIFLSPVLILLSADQSGTTAIIYDPMSREKIWINYDTSKIIYVF